jgi:glycosyltransferase involved in cell wall biosynthesis
MATRRPTQHTEQLRQLVARPGVTFHGQVEHKQILAALENIELLLVPSLWYETYSVNVDEALAAGVPVLVSSHGAAAERIEAEVSGLLAPPGDVAAWRAQMQRVRAEPGLLEQEPGATVGQRACGRHGGAVSPGPAAALTSETAWRPASGGWALMRRLARP